LVLILSEILIFNFDFFNEKIKNEIQKDNKLEHDNSLLKITMFRVIIDKVKELNKDCGFEELNSKKEFIKSKFQHDGNLAHLKKIYFCKFEDKEKTFAEIMQKDFNNGDLDCNSYLNSGILYCIEAITSYFLDLLQENNRNHNAIFYNNQDTNYSNFNNSNNYNIIDERVFVQKFVRDVIIRSETNRKNNNNINQFENNKINNNQVLQNPMGQSPLIITNKDLVDINENNYIYKTNLAKVNPNINNLRVPNNKANLFKNDNKNEKSYKALKFDGAENDPADGKEYNPMSLSANIVVNDWLNNLIKNNEKKYNFKFKEDVMQYLNENEQVN